MSLDGVQLIVDPCHTLSLHVNVYVDKVDRLQVTVIMSSLRNSNSPSFTGLLGQPTAKKNSVILLRKQYI